MAEMNFAALIFKSITELCESFEPVAKRNNISSPAILLLYALNRDSDLSFLAKEEYVNQLINFGFAKKEGAGLKITGKGAILAKSLEVTASKILKC